MNTELADDLKGSRFKSKDFLGWIYVGSVSKDCVLLKYEHVSGTDYMVWISIEKFNYNMRTGLYYVGR